MTVPNLTVLTVPADHRIYDSRPNGLASIGGILLHHTGSANEQGDIAWLSQDHANPVSIHRVFKRDGTIVQIVQDKYRAWHAGESTWAGEDNCNDWTIGFEICNKGDGKEAYTPGQIEAVSQSVAYLTALYHIPDSMIMTHALVRAAWLKKHPGTAKAKNDPLAWPMDVMWARVMAIRGEWPIKWPELWQCNR